MSRTKALRGVDGGLVLGRLADQALVVREGHVGRGDAVASGDDRDDDITISTSSESSESSEVSIFIPRCEPWWLEDLYQTGPFWGLNVGKYSIHDLSSFFFVSGHHMELASN